MGNAFENTFSQVKESESKKVDISTSQQADIVTPKIKEEKKTTKQHNNKAVSKLVDKSTSSLNNKETKQQADKLTSQHSNLSTLKISQEDLNTGELERKTFYLKPELAEMFKYAKFKKKIGESQIANIALENYFVQQYGKDWRTLLK